jgi:Flp pilus assembly protein TadD
MTQLRSALPVLLLLAGCATPKPPEPKIKDVPSSQVRLGDDMRANGDPAGALDLYRRAATESPHSAIPLERMGEAFTAAGAPDRAEQAFRAALVLDPANTQSQRGLAAALLSQGRAAEALPMLQNASDATMLRDLGVALDMLGRPAEAEAAYRRGLALAPADASLHGNLALSLAITGDNAGAEREIQAAIASPFPDARQQANEVLVLAVIGDDQRARDFGAQTLGEQETDALIVRAHAARDAADPALRARALGIMTKVK